jgi:hypothetical protein
MTRNSKEDDDLGIPNHPQRPEAGWGRVVLNTDLLKTYRTYLRAELGLASLTVQAYVRDVSAYLASPPNQGSCDKRCGRYYPISE